MEGVDLWLNFWGLVVRVRGKMGQKQCGLAEDYGDGLGDERESVWRMNKGPFGRQCDIPKLLAYSSFWRVKRPWGVVVGSGYPVSPQIYITKLLHMVLSYSSGFIDKSIAISVKFSLPLFYSSTPNLNNG